MSETQADTTSPGRTRRVRQNGPAIRSIRELNGYSQDALAKATGMTQANLSMIENERASAQVTTLSKIARQLRVPLAAVMRELDETAGSAA